MAGNDRRFSSYAREIDAAIERVVTHFEDNDVALRLDVLRGLAAHAKLAFESERVKQRLLQHPVAKDLVERVATRSSVFARLQRALAVEEFSCEYDRQRNVEMRALVRWALPAEEPKKQQTKKLKTASKRRARDERPLYMRYTFTRTTHEGADEEDEEAAAETIVTYSVAAGVGIDAEMKELVRYELASDSAYPRSFYEDQAMDSDEEEDDREEEEEKEPAAENDPSEDGDEDDEKSQQEGGEKDEFGEEVRGFDFDDTVMDAILEWLAADEDEIDPADVIGFFLALPMYEDDWTIDERVCQILFNPGPGGDSEMEEEVVSDFDDEDGGDAGSGEDEDVEVADLD